MSDKYHNMSARCQQIVGKLHIPSNRFGCSQLSYPKVQHNDRRDLLNIVKFRTPPGKKSARGLHRPRQGP